MIYEHQSKADPNLAIWERNSVEIWKRGDDNEN